MKNNLSIFNNLRPITVGFDDMFDHFEHMMDDGFFRNGTVSNFPPYNIVKTGKNTYNVELALEDGNVIHRGISKRFFSKSFTIANDVEIKGAELKDGLLVIALERIIPEAKKAKTIEIK
jgi:molecular chaperone IbpA